MPPLASNRILLAVFAALAAASVGLKAAAGPPPDGAYDVRPRQVEAKLEATLRAQGFSTDAESRPNRSEMIFGRRGECLLAARDARGGANFEGVFAADVRRIGELRYLYRGKSYGEPPSLAFRIGRLENELLNRLGVGHAMDVPIALAGTGGCGSGNFGLDAIRISP
jgi:hypothetical protein